MSEEKNERRVPKLRFKGFTDDWMQRPIEDIGEMNPTSQLPQTFKYVDLESVTGTTLIHYQDKTIDSAPSRAKRLAQKGDIFYQTVRPYQKHNFYFNKDEVDFVFSTGYAQIRPQKVSGEFLFYKMQNNNFVFDVLKRSTGTSYPAINSDDLAKIKINIPECNQEQEKIGNLLIKLDKIITLEQEKYSSLKRLKEHIVYTFYSEEDKKIVPLKSLASITTGKLNANAMDEDGEYDFYTSGVEKYKINEYAFEGPAFTVAGNGATVGYMHMADGKFNAYQRTYVLSDFKINRYYLYYNIQKVLPKKIHEESRTGSIPYIVMDMLEDLPISIVDINEMDIIGKILKMIDNKLNLLNLKIRKIKKVKDYLFENLFV